MTCDECSYFDDGDCTYVGERPCFDPDIAAEQDRELREEFPITYDEDAT